MDTTVSVIIPTHDRPDKLRQCLQCIEEQRYSGDVEILVFDDGTPDETAVRDAVEATDVSNVRVLRRANAGGPASARNRGAATATGDLLAFTDDDTRPRAGWVDALVEHYEAGAEVVEGRIVVPNGPRPLFSHAVSNEGGEYLTANIAYDRALFERLGGFCEDFASAHREDSDLAFSAMEANASIAFAPDAVVEHPHYPSTWWDVAADRDAFRYDALLCARHPERYDKYVKSPLERFSPTYLLSTIALPLVPIFLLVAGILGTVEARHYGYAHELPGDAMDLVLYGLARFVATWRLLWSVHAGCREYDVSFIRLLNP
jgi:glycosyltransferase involved in cell wall biosynthesis